MAEFKYTKTINTGMADLSKINGTTQPFFTGVDDEVNKFLDPLVTGYAFIYWVNVPEWFNKDEDLQYFKQMTQKNFRSFNGINAIELQTGQLNTGFAGNEINVVTGVQRSNTDFTIGHKEYSGSPMTKMYQKWISLIRDPRTGIALYPRLFKKDDGSNYEYGARNHSAQLLYIVTRPDVTNTKGNNVEFAVFYSNVVPTNVPLDSLYNFEIGNQESPTIDISFKGFPEISPAVTEFAKKILDEKIMTVGGDAYLPFVDSYNSNLDASSNVSWGDTNPLFEIYGKTEE